MKKYKFLIGLLITTLCSGNMVSISMAAENVKDFSYLETMSIEEIKELDVAIHEILENLSDDNNMSSECNQEEIVDVTREEVLGEWIGINNNHRMIITNSRFELIIDGENRGSSYGVSWGDFSDGKLSFGTAHNVAFAKVDGVIHATTSGWNVFDDDYVKKEDMIIENEYRLGETCKTDIIEMTITDIEFCKKLGLDPYLPIENGSGVVPMDGLIYASISFHVKNIDKSSMDYEKFTDFTLDYNNGYEYKVKENGYSYLVKIQQPLSTSLSRKFTENHAQGQEIKVGSLMEEDLVLNIPCAEIIKTDTEAPLKIIVNMPTSTGTERIVYIVYTDSETIKNVQEALNNNGYNCGVPDGISGNGTKAAIEKYQADHGLKVTGNINDNLINSLGI